MPDDKPVRFELLRESLADRGGTWLGAMIIGFEAFAFGGALVVFGLSSVADFAFLTFSLALLSTLARHVIRIDRAEESDNYEEISLHDRWHFSAPRRQPPGIGA